MKYLKQNLYFSPDHHIKYKNEYVSSISVDGVYANLETCNDIDGAISVGFSHAYKLIDFICKYYTYETVDFSIC